jgi:hypothetical protein
MAILLPILMVTLTIHFFLLIWTNKWRVNKLVLFVEKFNEEKILTESDYDYLYDRYTSFLSYMEFFPDKEGYKLLYENKEFEKFVATTRKRLNYYAIVTAACFALLAILIPISNQSN